MKYYFSFILLVASFLAKSQSGDKVVEYLIEDTKVAHLSTSDFETTTDAEIDIYASKGMPDINGAPVFTIEFSGYSKINTTRTDIEGDIYESEIDRVLHSLQFITDSLVNTKPSKKINYFLNLAESQFSISVNYDPELRREGWRIAIYLDRRYPTTHVAYVDARDLADLIKAIEKAKEEIKREK